MSHQRNDSPVAIAPRAVAPIGRPPDVRVEGYTVEALAGRGGFASVYRARRAGTGEMVALKILHPNISAAQKVKVRMRREAETLQRIAHPAVVRVLDHGELSSGEAFLVMEWIHGQTLRSLLQSKGRFCPDEVTGIMREICGGVAAAHDAGIVHRDLKASNVMLVPDGDWYQTKVVDFGIAKILDDAPGPVQPGLTSFGVALGTPSYMAPEQILGGFVDARADIYALGILIYLLLSGDFPFKASSEMEMMELHLYGEVPPLRSSMSLPPCVDDVIRRCMAKRPDDRYRTAHDLLTALEAAVRGGDTGSRSFGTPARKIGIYVETYFDASAEEIEDEALLAADDAIELADQVLSAAGAHVVLRTATSFWAVRDIEPGKQSVLSMLGVALDLRDRITAVAGPFSGLHVTVAMQMGDADRTGRAAARSPRLGADVVIASGELVAGLEDTFVLRELEDSSGRVRVERFGDSTAFAEDDHD